ncbi:hypothetical protein P5V15_010816 [Pogonomyrmex californicus]
MKCIIPGGNVKILARAIHMLARIGDEMYVIPQQEAISFRTVNMAKSAYSDFIFHKNFFSYYALGDLLEEEAQRCKISMRSAMTIFKSAHTLDKQVETCHILLEVNASNLVFILKYKNGINKAYLSPILDSDKLQASYSTTGMPNQLTSRARILMDALQNFPQNQIEITLEVTPHKLLLRNYVDDASVMVNTTRTQLALGIGEFDRYTIGNETSITFCLKEFRASLIFSESVGIPITANFETAGRPILLTLKSQAFETNLLLSTLILDCDSQSDTSVVRNIQSVRKKNTSSRSTSRGTNKSSSRIKKSDKSKVNDTSKKRITKEKNQVDKIFNQNKNAANVVSAKENNSVNDVREKNLHIPEQNHRSVTFNPTSTSSTTGSKISENQRKLINSVFSNITKRKSTSEEENDNNEVEVVRDRIALDKSVPRSPSRQVTKRARLVFQKCFQDTFDSRMLPGHNTILVEDSDENNSD